MPPPWLIVASWSGLALVAGVGAWFARRQNRGARMGGAISRAKQVWLVWAVYVWFVLTPLLAAAPVFSPGVRGVLGVFAAFMIARGLVELVMLFVTKNWRPPMGIAHDGACVVLLLAGSVWVMTRDEPHEGLRAWGVAHLAVLTVSLMLETVYAIAFHRAVEGRTTGEDGVWFAAAGEARFARVNRLTAFANVPLVIFVLVLLIALTLPGFAAAQTSDESSWHEEDKVQLALRHNARPLTMPEDVFDVFFDGSLTALSSTWVAATVAAGARYGLTDDLEIGLRLLRATMSEAPGTGIARPTIFAGARLGAGPFEAAFQLETELPTSAGGLQMWLRAPMLVRAGPYVRLDVAPVISTVTQTPFPWSVGVPAVLNVQITDRLRAFGAAELTLPDLRKGGAVLTRLGGGFAFVFGAPKYELVAQLRSPALALAGERQPDPAFGNYLEGGITFRLFFQGLADDPAEPLF